MVSLQRYISKELIHFLGRELTEDEKRYQLLIKILKEGWITHHPHIPTIFGNLNINPSAKISNNEMYNPECVCFCDIPITDIDIHTRKYSRFGISFLKEFLTSQGANPVFYITNNSNIFQYMASGTNLGDHLDTSMKEYHDFVVFLHESVTSHESKDPWREEVKNKFKNVANFLDFIIFSYLKCFDNTLSEDNEKNYYMEREWRIICNLKFALKDVHRVILPKEYSQRFRAEMPIYSGQVTFTE
jgi:hypothetical protein